MHALFYFFLENLISSKAIVQNITTEMLWHTCMYFPYEAVVIKLCSFSRYYKIHPEQLLVPDLCFWEYYGRMKSSRDDSYERGTQKYWYPPFLIVSVYFDHLSSFNILLVIDHSISESNFLNILNKTYDP